MHTWVIVTLIIIAILVIKICIAQLITHLANPNRKTFTRVTRRGKTRCSDRRVGGNMED